MEDLQDLPDRPADRHHARNWFASGSRLSSCVIGNTPDVVWLADGEKRSDDRGTVELALGWGAFGKKVIVVSEDAKNDLLKKLIRQWPEIERAVIVLPGRDYKHLLTKEEAQELRASLGDKFKILVHRDRDSLTDEEVVALQDSYASEGIRLWLTDQSDLEAEFCDPGFLSALTGEPTHTCEAWLTEISSQNQVPIKELFASQRAAHNEELHKAGGSPTNEDVWAAFQGRSLKGAKGKFIFKQLKNKVPANAFSEAAVDSLVAYPERAASLKANLEDLLALPRRTGSETVRFSCSTLDPAALDNEFSAYVVCQ